MNASFIDCDRISPFSFFLSIRHCCADSLHGISLSPIAHLDPSSRRRDAYFRVCLLRDVMHQMTQCYYSSNATILLPDNS